tara:strand:+ start:2569 stop:2994 length:426 start_codon:yes stop_codon:yes gene_type:complete
VTIKLLGIDHVVLRVRDVPASLDFYCRVLGCEIERNVESIGLIQLRAGRSLIDLVDVEGELGRSGGAPAGSEGRNLDHFALRIETFDEERIRDWLAQHDIDVGDSKERYGAEGSEPSFYITDPDGNVVELKGPATVGIPVS